MPNKNVGIYTYIHSKKTSAVVTVLAIFSPRFVKWAEMELGNSKDIVSYKCKGVKFFPVVSSCMFQLNISDRNQSISNCQSAMNMFIIWKKILKIKYILAVC